MGWERPYFSKRRRGCMGVLRKAPLPTQSFGSKIADAFVAEPRCSKEEGILSGGASRGRFFGRVVRFCRSCRPADGELLVTTGPKRPDSPTLTGA